MTTIGFIVMFACIIVLSIVLSILAYMLGKQIDKIYARIATIVNWCEVLRDNQEILSKSLQRLYNEQKSKKS